MVDGWDVDRDEALLVLKGRIRLPDGEAVGEAELAVFERAGDALAVAALALPLRLSDLPSGYVVGVAGFVAVVAIILFLSAGQPWGTINDLALLAMTAAGVDGDAQVLDFELAQDGVTPFRVVSTSTQTSELPSASRISVGKVATGSAAPPRCR